MVIFDVVHADFFSHPARGHIVRINDGDKLLSTKFIACEVFACICCFGCESLPLDVGAYVIANLKFRTPVDFLPGEAAVSQECAIEGPQKPGGTIRCHNDRLQHLARM